MIFPTCKVDGLPDRFPEGPIVKGPGMDLGYSFITSQPNLSVLEQSWLHDSQWCVTDQVGTIPRTPLKNLFPRPGLMLSFPWTQS